MNWHNASKSEPCPICKKPDWCNLSDDGVVCICHRVESPYPAKSGSGWIHRLKERNDPPPAARCQLPATRHQRPTIDFARVHASYDDDSILVEGLATTLGIDDEPLKAMDVRFNRFDECWSFPMRDAEGRVVGLRFRELAGSRKWSARGSRDGLFYIPGDVAEQSRRAGPVELIVVEGASDAAALLSLLSRSTDCCVVGRSSCQSGEALIRRLIRRIRPKVVTIVADNDAPGIQGANRLAAQLNAATCPPLRVLIVPHPYKDIRSWYLSSRLTPKLYRDLVSAQRWCGVSQSQPTQRTASG